MEENEESTALDRAAELRAAKAVRERARAQEREAMAVEGLELEEKYETELGPRGQKFEIVDCTHVGCGFVVVKLGATVEHKHFKASKMTDVDAQDYVLPSLVHPKRPEFLAISSKHGEVVHNVALALARLHGLRVKDEEGKA